LKSVMVNMESYHQITANLEPARTGRPPPVLPQRKGDARV